MIRRIANAFSDLEGLAFLATLLVGLGVLGYVSVKWLIYLFTSGHYFFAGAAGLVTLLLFLFAVLRVPLAQLVLFGSFIVVGTAFLTNSFGLLLP
jgi:hypothetical protein